MPNSKKIILPLHKTKIICTIGPASNSSRVIKKMIKNGMSIVRLNFSHGNLEEHKKTIKLIKKITTDSDNALTILVDLPGAKIRVGKLESEPITLKKGDYVTLTTKDVLGSSSIIPVDYARLPDSVSKGSKIYLNDGLIELKTLLVNNDTIKCKVIIGGIILSHKGFSIPGAKLFLDTITDRDLQIVDFCLNLGVNTFGLSFIKNKEDILKVKEYARKKGKTIHCIAKIERREAIKHFDEILKSADGVMIARGDLGVEIPLQEVPVVQKKLIRKANLVGCPVITATQMLESMTKNTRPTRAEVTDVANSILDGTDAIMLSEETAIGNFPIETVTMMAKIATYIERNRNIEGFTNNLRNRLKKSINYNDISVADVISLNVIEATEILKIKFVFTPTESGNTARRISRFKPNCWVLAFSRDKDTCTYLPFSYGVFPFFSNNKLESWHEFILTFVKNASLVKKGDKVILTQRRFAKQKGGTDSLGIITIE